MPDSVVVDAGSGALGGVLTAANGTSYVRPALIEGWSDDFDGEVYGNFRRMGAETDIGFDESDVVTLAGGYYADSRSYGPSPCAAACTGGAPSQGGVRYLLFPAAGAWSLYRTSLPMAGSPAWAAQPGTLDPPLPLTGFVGASSLLWIGLVPFPALIASGVTSTQPFTFPGGGLTHTIHFASLPLPAGDCLFLNEQALFLPAVGEPILPGFYASNLQQSFDG